MKRLLETFEEPSGGLSSMRVCFLVFSFTLCFSFGVASWRKGEVASIPLETASVLGLFAGAKAFQRKVEEPAPSSVTT
jgi:hypothetical protein